ncbi:hypothetical protein K4L44_05860 [Halosquirtibacter laminarini]|uniref:Uncharacterized protein n=1 Tax=Halosquirtibacter laminarini TaxID=3374600 RepID=A0AC61NQ82_9BACT|nr:hypothetical protein K4L44_05860 [Prolixibacteraceae bacterium]
MKVEIIRCHPFYSYFVGDKVELGEPVAQTFITGKYAMPIVSSTQSEENQLHEDLPYRELLFENGYTSLDEIEKAGESLIEVNGIGNKAMEKVLHFIQDLKV